MPSLDRNDGFSYWPNAISESMEAKYIEDLHDLHLSQMKMFGHYTKRSIGRFGSNVYNYHGAAPEPGPLPAILVETRSLVSELVSVPAEAFSAVTVQRYPVGAGIGPHVDSSVYGVIAGLSLGGNCEMLFEPAIQAEQRSFKNELTRRSVYLLSGHARSNFTHSIPNVKEERYSITLRTLKHVGAKVTSKFLQ